MCCVAFARRNDFSRLIQKTCGMRQGRVLFCCLPCTSIAFLTLCSAGLGCCVGGMYMGCMYHLCRRHNPVISIAKYAAANVKFVKLRHII